MATESATDVAARLEDGAEIDLGGARDQSARGGRGKGKGSGGGGGGAVGGGQNREVLISKALSKLLRHAAEEEGLKLDGEGYARLDLVVSFCFFLSLGI